MSSTSSAAPALEVAHVTHRYGQRVALGDVSLRVEPGEIFAFLGPNGGGKTTLFRLISTLVPLQVGAIRVFWHDVAHDTLAVRRAIGVVFQAPSLDKKLTVAENLRHQGHLYGLSGVQLHDRVQVGMARLGVTDRAGDLCETLSGGLRRRVELAKGLLHQPRLLLLDEPSTGLDPGARRELWNYLGDLRREAQVTIVLTTHLLDEAEKADRLAILDAGKIVALDTPNALRATVGGDTILLEGNAPEELARQVTERFACPAQVMDGAVRLEQPDGHQWIARLVEAFPGQLRSVRLGKPTLEDVFVARTGHQFWRREENSGG